MKNLLKVLSVVLVLAFLFTSCAKQPTQEVSNAEAAIKAVENEGADVYAKEELAKLKNDLSATLDEVNAQSKKFFKKYGNAKQMLEKVKTDADAVKALIPQRKEQAKNEAIAKLEEAKVAVDEAKAFLAKAPRGKGTKADIQAFTADLEGLVSAVAEAQQLIDSENYFGAQDKATAIKEKAQGISDQIKQAIEKVKKR